MARLTAYTVLVVFFLTVSSASLAELRAPDKAEEYNLKAALVINFARFSQWPDASFTSEKDPVVLCVLGDTSLNTSFLPLTTKKVAGRTVRVLVAENLPTPTLCHVVFVAGSTREGLPRLFAGLAGQPVLTIGEVNGFGDVGGMINFTTVGGRLKFIVNLTNTRSGGIGISSRLLKLAHTVEGQGA